MMSSSSEAMSSAEKKQDLRLEAEERVRIKKLKRQEMEKRVANVQKSSPIKSAAYALSASSSSSSSLKMPSTPTSAMTLVIPPNEDENSENILDASNVQNLTPHHARLAALDYKINGSRARANSGDFISPRWVPDEYTSNCSGCDDVFEWVNRRHHCK